MIIQSLILKNFRCFADKTLNFDGRVVLIHGENGSGKSSVLEALHYCCYLKSFRTHIHKELIQIEKKHFFISIDVYQENVSSIDTVHVGFSPTDGKVVSCNKKAIRSHKELIEQFKIVTLTADDIELVHGAPDFRRDFLNYALILQNPSAWLMLKRHKQALEQRNHLLLIGKSHTEEFLTWTQQLWEQSYAIRLMRYAYLEVLQKRINVLFESHFTAEIGLVSIQFEYLLRGGKYESFDLFWKSYQQNLEQERLLRRSLFGAHLDDFSIIFFEKKAKIYASRGQQKLLVLLIKIAQLLQISDGSEQGVLLLDDFITDFDLLRVKQCFSLLQELKGQVFVSTPVKSDFFYTNSDLCKINISSI